jgi:hypothetical protein
MYCSYFEGIEALYSTNEFHLQCDPTRFSTLTSLILPQRWARIKVLEFVLYHHTAIDPSNECVGLGQFVNILTSMQKHFPNLQRLFLAVDWTYFARAGYFRVFRPNTFPPIVAFQQIVCPLDEFARKFRPKQLEMKFVVGPLFYNLILRALSQEYPVEKTAISHEQSFTGFVRKVGSGGETVEYFISWMDVVHVPLAREYDGHRIREL